MLNKYKREYVWGYWQLCDIFGKSEMEAIQYSYHKMYMHRRRNR